MTGTMTSIAAEAVEISAVFPDFFMALGFMAGVMLAVIVIKGLDR